VALEKVVLRVQTARVKIDPSRIATLIGMCGLVG
jgi:hypothetical protein